MSVNTGGSWAVIGDMHSSAHHQLVHGLRFQAEGDHLRAVGALLAALEVAPDRAATWLAAATSLAELGRLGDALAAVARATALQPGWGAARRFEGELLARLGWMERAAAAFAAACEADPDDHGAAVLLGQARLALGQSGAARVAFARAVEADPSNRDAVAGLARVLERDGDRESAFRLLRPLASLRAPSLQVALGFASVATSMGRPAEALPVVRSGLRAHRSDWHRAMLLHALGDVHEALGDVVPAFEAHRRAHASRSLEFDARDLKEEIDELLVAFDADAFETLPRAPDADPLPVFVVGLPRSGTSLVEQMLDAHPDVAGAGELETLRVLSESILGRLRREGPDDVLSPVLVREAGRSYRGRLRRVSAIASRVVDKMPTNFRHLWLAGLALPGARIIHCVRDPVDVAWSIYRQNFPSGSPWATSVEGIAAMLDAHDRLMAHWRGVLPLPILEVRYEELVADPTATVAGILRFLDLPWNDACARPEHNPRPVVTASALEVRAPVHTRSVGRGHRFAPFFDAALRSRGR
jgi:tetratricopeptide (TPR) repeat protein